MDVIQPNPPGLNAIPRQRVQGQDEPGLKRSKKSSILIFGKVTADHPALKDEDPELQEIVLEEIDRTDTNNDGEVDRDEFVVAMKNTAKRSRASALKERNLEVKLKKSHQTIAGLSVISILVVIVGCVALFFALTNGNSQVTSTIESSTESVLDSQATRVSVDADGTPHLVDRAGADVSVQASGVVADARSRVLADGSEVVCVPLSAVARAVHGLSSSTEASIVARDGEGVVKDILPLSGAFHDGGDKISFDGGKVVVRLDSSECDVLAEGGDEGEGKGVEDVVDPEDTSEEGSDEKSGDPFERRLRHPAKTGNTDRILPSSRADVTTKTDLLLTGSHTDVLRRNREKYVSFLGAVRQGQRRLQDTDSVPAYTGPSFSTDTCNSSVDQFKRNVFRVPISSITSETVLDDSSTPQARALWWIANNDQIHPALIPGIDDEQIIQRYILAAFYYAVNGNTNSNLAGWMSSLPVCADDWTGVECDHDAGGPSVTGIHLGQNGLTGSMIPELSHLSSLITLNLRDNSLSGTIPVELGGLTNLKNLYLSVNDLTGSIPTQLGSLSLLENLFLDNNQLSNGIPTEMGSLGELKELNLERNELTGDIPAELGGLFSLRAANFFQNSLVGQMPAEICSLKSGNADFNILKADCMGNPPEVLCYRPCCTINSCPARPTPSPTVIRGGTVMPIL